MRPNLVLALAVGGLAFLTALLVPNAASAGPKAKKHLHFRSTYAEALLEARVRNIPVLVSRHKDD